MAERLTWDQVQGANFSGANEQARLASGLLGSASAPLIGGIDDYQKALAAQQSAQLMQRVNAQQDPAAVAAALSSGDIYKGLDPRYLSPEAQQFAAGQAQRLLNQSQTTAETGRIGAATGLIGVQTQQGQYDLNRQSQIIDPRADAEYAAKQALEPIQAEVDRLARSGDITGAQDYARQHASAYADANVPMSSINDAISTQATGGRSDVTATDTFSESLRGMGQRNDARSILTAGQTHFKTLPEFTVGVENAVRSGLISPEAGQMAIKNATDTGAFNNSSPDAGVDNQYGTNLTPQANNDWLNGGRDAFNALMTRSESSGNRTAINNDNPNNPAGGPLQFTQARIDDAIAAGVLPKGTTVESFAAMGKTPEGAALQDRAGAWHWAQIDKQAKDAGLEQYYGQTIQGVPINRDSIRAMAQIGGFQGMMDFLRTGKNPSDGNTTIRDYGLKFAGVDPMAPTRGQNDPALGFGQTVPQVKPDPYVGPDPAAQLAEAARVAAEKATTTISPLVPNAAPQTVAQGPSAAAAATAALQGAIDPTVPLPAPVDGGQVPPMQQMLDTNLANAANAPRTSVPVDFAAQQAAGLQAQAANPDANNVTRAILNAQGYDAGQNPTGAATQTGGTPDPSVTSYGVKIGPIPAEDPSRSGLNTMINGNNLQEYVRNTTGDIAAAIGEGKVNGYAGGSLSNALGNLGDFVWGGNDAAANANARKASADATAWWQSNAAQSYFQANPNELQTAAQDPIGFAQSKLQASQAEQLSQDAKTAAEKAQQDQPFQMVPTTGPVNPDRLKADLGMVADQFTADAAFADMPNVISTYAALPSDASVSVVAAALTATGSAASDTAPGVEAGALSGLDRQTVANRLIEIMDATGIKNPAIAGAFLVNTPIKDYNPSWGAQLIYSPEKSTIDVEKIKTDMQRFAGGTSGTPTAQTLVARLNEGRAVQDATSKLATVQQEFKAAQDQLQAYIDRPGTTPEMDANARRQYEQMVFPQIREKLRAVHATGLSTLNANRSVQN